MNKIVFYHQKSCGPCRMVEMLLAQKHIQYESCQDIAVMEQKNIVQTPTLEVDGTRLVGSKEVLAWIKQQPERN